MEAINGIPFLEVWQAHARNWARGYKEPPVDCADLALLILIMFAFEHDYQLNLQVQRSKITYSPKMDRLDTAKWVKFAVTA